MHYFFTENSFFTKLYKTKVLSLPINIIPDQNFNYFETFWVNFSKRILFQCTEQQLKSSVLGNFQSTTRVCPPHRTIIPSLNEALSTLLNFKIHLFSYQNRSSSIQIFKFNLHWCDSFSEKQMNEILHTLAFVNPCSLD